MPTSARRKVLGSSRLCAGLLLTLFAWCLRSSSAYSQDKAPAQAEPAKAAKIDPKAAAPMLRKEDVVKRVPPSRRALRPGTRPIVKAAPAAPQAEAPKPAEPAGAPVQPAPAPGPTPVPAPPGAANAPPPGAEVGIDATPWNKVEVPGQLTVGIEFKKPDKGVRFAFNLVDAGLVELIKIMGNITGKAFILGGAAPNIKATIYAPTRITADEAYQAFLSVLQVNGLTVVPAGKYLKILPVAGATQKNMPILSEKAVPPGDQIVTRLHPLEHVAAEELSELLNRFKSADGDIMVYAPTNTLIITDYGSSIRRLLKLISILDAPGTGEQIWIEPVNYADATELSQRIIEIFEISASPSSATQAKEPAARTPRRRPTQKTGAQQPGTGVVGEEASETKISKIIPDERTNSLIIVASENAYLRIIELIKRLDIPIEGEGTLHVYKMQHADSEELAKTLNNLTKGASAASATKKKGQSGEGAAVLFEGEIQISADKSTNSLVIVSSIRDYMKLKSVIEQLDTTQRQVFVEAAIMEVSLSKDRNVGVGWHAGSAVDMGGGGKSLVYGSSTPTSSLSSLLLTPGAMSGLAAGLRGPALEGTEDLLGVGLSIPAFGVSLQALQTNSDVNVLSTPNILATDNVEASITVGENVPIQAGYSPMGSLISQVAGSLGTGTQSTTTPSSSTAAALGMAAGYGGMYSGFSINRQNVGITLNITPHINDDNQVRLEIKLEISEVASVDPTLGPNISKKDASTTSVVADQQTIVIGGLMTDNEVETTQKVPVLGDIPILGFLFRSKSTSVKKRNLLIFLTPYIVRTSDDFREIFQRKMAERREFIERWTAFEYHRVDPHLDWSRTNGVISEINLVVGQAQRDAELKRQSELSSETPHVPKEAIKFETVGAKEGPAAARPEAASGEVVPQEAAPAEVGPGDMGPDGSGGDTSSTPGPSLEGDGQ